MSNPASTSDSATPAPSRAERPSSGSSGADRRKYFRLRELIDEMLASVRVATNQDFMTPEERADAERQLAAIMTRVRSEALSPSERAEGSATSDGRAD